MPCHCVNDIDVGFALKAGGEERTLLVATRDISAHTPLTILCGDLTPAQFVIKCACLPTEILSHCSHSGFLMDHVNAHVLPALAPPKKLHARACWQVGLPWTVDRVEKDFVMTLPCHALDPHRQASVLGQGENPQLQSLRQFLVACHMLTDEQVQFNIETGRLRANPFLPHLAQLHLMAVDHALETVTSLNESTHEEHLQHATDASNPDKPSWWATLHREHAFQRDALAQWQHAFCQRCQCLNQTAKAQPVWDAFCAKTATAQLFGRPLALENGGASRDAPSCWSHSQTCRVCGKTTQLKACSKCKMVKHCGRDHQAMDRKKGHRQECRVSVRAE